MPEPQHLETLTIRGFRGLEHVDFPRFGRINLLVGRNDVGKTSVLEAVFLAAGFAELPLPVAIQNNRKHLVRDFRDLLLLFHRRRGDVAIEFDATTSVGRRSLRIAAEPTSGVVDQDVHPSSKAVNGDASPVGHASYSSKPSIQYALRYTATLASKQSSESTQRYTGTLSVADGQVALADDPGSARLRNETIPATILLPNMEYGNKSIADVVVAKKDDRLIECLLAINPDVAAIAVGGDTTYVDIGLDRMVPIGMCGNGLVRGAHILSVCLLDDVRIVLIDEIGNGLHHSAIESVLTAIITMCEQQDIQVFLTTHSLEVMQCFTHALSTDLQRFQSETACYALARNENKRVRAYRYDYEQLDHAVSNRIEIR